MARKSQTISIITEDPVFAPLEIAAFPDFTVGRTGKAKIGTGGPKIGVDLGVFDGSKESAFSKIWQQPLASSSWTKTDVNTDELTKSLGGLLKSMDGVLSSLPAFIGEFRLDSMTLDVEISAEGSVSLLGTGGKLSGKGGISLTLKRPENSPGKPKSGKAT